MQELISRKLFSDFNSCANEVKKIFNSVFLLKVYALFLELVFAMIIVMNVSNFYGSIN